MEPFNPFGKPIDELKTEDLITLKDIPEGLFIDYKREASKPKDIAKFLSSFSNQFGGWLIFGIDDGEDKKPGSFSGILRSEVGPSLEKIRNASYSSVSPSIFYEEKVLNGPCEEMKLQEEKCIIVIYIPPNVRPPHIHNSGKIFIRQSDQSVPIPTTDRNTLDRLHDRSKEFDQSIKKFCKYKPEFDYPFIVISFIPSPYHSRPNVSFDSVHEIWEKCFLKPNFKDIKMSTTFENVSTTPGGFIARFTNQKLVLGQTMYVRWDFDGFTRIVLNPNIYKQLRDMKTNVKGQICETFAEELNKQHPHFSRIVDLTQIFLGLGAAINHLNEFFKQLGEERPYKYSIAMHNFHGSACYANIKSYTGIIRRYGIPLIEERKVFMPLLSKYENLFSITQLVNNGNDNIPLTILIALQLFRALGFNSFDTEASIETLGELFQIRKG